MEDRMLNATTLGRAGARNRVLRNTYNLLALSMLPTVAGAWLGVQLNFASLFAGSPIMGSILMLVAMFGLIFAIKRYQDSSVGVVLLLGFTFVMGLLISNTLQWTLRFSNGGSLIAMAAGGTAVIFFGMSTLASVIKRDLSGLGNFLFIGTLLLIVAGIANLFFQIPAFQLTIAVIGCALFSVWLLFDLNRVINGGETNYVSATLKVYLDLVNIFVNLLQILGMLGGNRD
ncbi:MAG: FtsH interacting integral rane protein [Rhodocyclales bacterium]|nr:FtsH interacting integral rane protein [Rhodocyclales bacterium]